MILMGKVTRIFFMLITILLAVPVLNVYALKDPDILIMGEDDRTLSDVNYTELAILGRKEGIKIRILERGWRSGKEFEFSKAKGVIFYEVSDTKHLQKVYNYVKNGGRAIWFGSVWNESFHSQEMKESLADIYGISVTQYGKLKKAQVKIENYLPYFRCKGMLALPHKHDSLQGINEGAFVITGNENYRTPTHPVKPYNNEYHISVLLNIGKGQIIFALPPAQYSDFFINGRIGLLDNKDITKCMIRWLVGNSQTINTTKNNEVNNQKKKTNDAFQFKYCKKCNRKYPFSYNYCSFDGEKLHISSDNKNITIKRISLIDNLIDAALTNSGINPDSEIAKKAKTIGKSTLNPFKSNAELKKDIDSLVKTIISN